MTVHMPRISVAVPLYNEEQGVAELLRRVRAVLEQVPGGPHELVLVDDGSSDRTFEIIAKEATQEANILAISLSRNFGHQSAPSPIFRKDFTLSSYFLGHGCVACHSSSVVHQIRTYFRSPPHIRKYTRYPD